jgi:putative phosphoribosyl transferase
MNVFAEVAQPVLVWTGKVMLEGSMAVPAAASATVVVVSVPALADASRDAHLVSELYRYGIATMYVPLLTAAEQEFDGKTHQYRFDSDFLAQRLVDVAGWVATNQETRDLPLGLIGSSASGAAAICAAVQRPDIVSAVVSIDGRTDLAVDCLRNIKTPTLLVVHDMPVLRMNREALTLLKGDKRLEIVHGGEEETALSIAQRAVLWMADKLAIVPADAWSMV